MSTTLIIVAIVAVIVIAAVVLSLRRKAAPGEVPESPEGVSAPPREPAPPQAAETERPRGQPAGEVPAGAPAVAAAEAESRAEEAEQVEAEAEKGEAEPEPVEAVAEPAVAEDLSARVEAQIEDSERMLGELREVAGAATEGAAPRVDAGTLDIMTEGLQEVRALAKKDWSQAKDKSQALHAQISLLLQTARRQQTS